MTINLTKYNDKIKTQIKNWINQSLEVLKDFAEVISPEDTREFVRAHKIDKATESLWIITWTLYNDTEYAWILEYWVWWNKYNYHKWKVWWPRQIIYSWVWNRTYTRTADTNESEIKKIIESKIKLN